MRFPWEEFDAYAAITVRQVSKSVSLDGVSPRVGMAPLAFDIDPASDFGAVSWAVRDLHPRDHIGWWGLARIYVRSGDSWDDRQEYDNAIVDEPFARWDGRHDGKALWVDLGSNTVG